MLYCTENPHNKRVHSQCQFEYFYKYNPESGIRLCVPVLLTLIIL